MSRTSPRKAPSAPKASPPAAPEPAGPSLLERLDRLGPLLPALAVVLALLPILNILRIITTVGGESPSVDYFYYIPMIDQILDGRYDWSRYFRDTFMAGAHSMALPVALRLAIIKLTAWNLRAELYLVVLLSVLRLLVLHRLLTASAPGPVRWLLLPLLSALIFSTSQVEMYTYGDAGLQLSLIHLCFALGLWALVRAEGRTSGVVWMAVAGVLASLSGGGGLGVWPVFLVAMAVLGYRRRGHFLAWAVAGLLGFLPYLINALVHPKSERRRIPGFISPSWFVHALGWPFANDIGAERESSEMAFGAGATAVLLLVIGGVLLHALGRRGERRAAVPALLVLLMGLISTAMIGMFRRSIGPWYTTPFMVVWMGLVALTIPVWLLWREQSRDSAATASSLHRLTPLWIGGVPLIVIALYLSSNLTYADKSMLLYYRSPASTSALRNFRTAPTYSADLLSVNVPRPTMLQELGGPLEKHRLSLFSRRQTWELQGDFVLDSVTVAEDLSALPVRWCEGPEGPVLSWNDFRHLDLRLHGASQVSWRVKIPQGAAEATFHSAVAMMPYESANSAGWKLWLTGPASGEEGLASGELTGAFGAWKPLLFPLAKYAGQEVTLHLASTSPVGSAPVLFRSPRLELDLPQPPAPPVPDELRPSNTSRSPHFPKDTPRDLVLSLDHPELWQLDNTLMAVSDGLRLYPGESAQFRPRLEVDPREFSHLKLEIQAEEEVDPPALRIFFGLERPDGRPDFPFTNMIVFPDGRPGGYTYNLRLLELEPGTRLQTLRFFSISEGGPLRITGCRLVRKPS